MYIFRCRKCNWPLCAPSCSGLYVQSGHEKAECDFLTAILFDEELQRDKTNLYNCIVPLRCLLLGKKSESEWKLLKEMESHDVARRKISDVWELNENTVVKKLQKYFDPQEIHTICGILEACGQFFCPFYVDLLLFDPRLKLIIRVSHRAALKMLEIYPSASAESAFSKRIVGRSSLSFRPENMHFSSNLVGP